MNWALMHHPSTTADLTTVQLGQSESPASGESQSAYPAGIVCDVGAAGAFAHSYNSPHVPVLAAFGGDRLHRCGIIGSWDLERAVTENPQAFYRSIRRLFPRKA